MAQRKNIVLSDRLQLILNKLVCKRKIEKQLTFRINIILLSAAGYKYREICKQLDCCDATISFWRYRWTSNYEKLTTFCNGIDSIEVSGNEIIKEIFKIMGDAPRTGAPVIFTEDIQKKIQAMACEAPETYNLPYTHWTDYDLREQIIKSCIVDSISTRQVGRILKKNELAPHKSEQWLHPKIDNKEDFANTVEELCDVYKQADLTLVNENNTEISNIEYHCTDEKTGIQALERQTKAMQVGKPEKREPEYIRHGTQTLLASRSVNTGVIDAYTVGDSRKEEDFLAHIKDVVTTNLQARHGIICDQLNTHKSASLVEYISLFENDKLDLGEKGKSGILKNMASRMAYLENKDHKVFIIYTPKHCSWLNQIENWFGLLQRKVIKRGVFTSKENLRGKIIAFIEYYNKYYAKPYVWKKSATEILEKLMP